MMTDPIERQAAIDAVAKWLYGVFGIRESDGTATIFKQLRALPSAQPEPKWIPCSERLPDESGKYLVTAFEGAVRITTVAPYQSTYRLWAMTGRRTYWKVIAWMPLPEPYKEGDQDG